MTKLSLFHSTLVLLSRPSPPHLSPCSRLNRPPSTSHPNSRGVKCPFPTARCARMPVMAAYGIPVEQAARALKGARHTATWERPPNVVTMERRAALGMGAVGVCTALLSACGRDASNGKPNVTFGPGSGGSPTTPTPAATPTAGDSTDPALNGPRFTLNPVEHDSGGPQAGAGMGTSRPAPDRPHLGRSRTHRDHGRGAAVDLFRGGRTGLHLCARGASGIPCFHSHERGATCRRHRGSEGLRYVRAAQ